MAAPVLLPVAAGIAVPPRAVAFAPSMIVSVTERVCRPTVTVAVWVVVAAAVSGPRDEPLAESPSRFDGEARTPADPPSTARYQHSAPVASGGRRPRRACGVGGCSGRRAIERRRRSWRIEGEGELASGRAGEVDEKKEKTRIRAD